jgi:Neuraminidase (sialidase)
MNPVLRGQRFDGFKAAGITVEYSTDAGSTWTAYTLTDDAKRNLFTMGGNVNIIGG